MKSTVQMAKWPLALCFVSLVAFVLANCFARADAIPPLDNGINAGAALAQANGCAGCHGSTWHGGIGPALYGAERRLAGRPLARPTQKSSTRRRRCRPLA